MARHSPVPVLFVRSMAVGVTWRGEPLLRRVLIPLDGSELAETMLEHAVVLATPGETELSLLQVVVPIEVASDPFITNGIAFDRDDVERRQRAAETYLENVAAELRAIGFATTVRAIVHGQVARAILDYAQLADTDLIALATHGRGALARVALGSVADTVLREATTLLLMFHPSSADVARHA
jgi:nucleotide-binding universal stress UspA family protein